jgi:glycosyltransferase involved in cell wall biosynthesis
MSYTGTVVVIPTRNRGSIAMNAIRSVLDQEAENVDVLVSDNSTSESDRETLASFHATCADKRLRYVRPPEPLSMTAHWEWAIQQALGSYSASHFLFLTDRMMFRSGAVNDVLRLAARYPDKIISYNLDRIVDDSTPIKIEQYPGSGRLFAVTTERLSQLFAQSVFYPALPRMLNCIVPRTVLRRINERFGNVFSSTSPDFNFCCRCLELEESLLFYDRAPVFHYALSRSNGASVTRGEMTADNADFTANLPVDTSDRNFATPIPALNTAVNAAFHEYFLFKQQTNSDRFFAVDKKKYLEANANEVAAVIDPVLREQTISLLVEHGYRENGVNDPAPVNVAFSKRALFKFKRIATGPVTTKPWLFLARLLAINPPGANSFEFATLDEAINYAKNLSRGNIVKRWTHLELLRPREMPK